MEIILLHGMGRSPISMVFLYRRLAKLGHQPRLFWYTPTFESLEDVTVRLVTLLEQKIAPAPYALAGHSLGSVIIRNSVPRLGEYQPAACFFLAPPIVSPKGAKITAGLWPYQLYNGEMGQLLAQDEFMDQLPMPENTKIYVGTRGPKAEWLPLGTQTNDGILSVEEATGEYDDLATEVDSMHTFIMNSDVVMDDIARTLKEIHL